MRPEAPPPARPTPRRRGQAARLGALVGAVVLAVLVRTGAIPARRLGGPEPGPSPTEPAQSTLSFSPGPAASATGLPAARQMPRAAPRVAALPGAPRSGTGGGAEGNVVEFEVVNGLAIAFGDLVLGQPEEGSAVRRGRYEAPHPQLWEGGEVPYAISPELPNPRRIEQAIEYFNRNTTVRFVPYQNQPDALVFQVGPENCYSYLGKVGGLQPVLLAASCQWPEIVHELMHALGFIHEQMRIDRDQFVEVLWENIEERYRPQFAIAPDSFMEALRGTPFDFRSAMLYRPEAFAARPGTPTMRALGPEPIQPVREGLSEGDLFRLRRLYRR